MYYIAIYSNNSILNITSVFALTSHPQCMSVSLLLQKLSLVHVNSNQCLDKASEDDSQVPSVKDCTGIRSQQWLLRNVTLPEIFWAHTRADRWTDSHTVADGGNVRERMAFLSILVVCLQMISKNRTTYVYESPHHSTLQRKRTNDGERLVEKETWVWCRYPPRSRGSGHFGYVYENASLLEYQCVCVYVRVRDGNVWVTVFSTGVSPFFNLNIFQAL